MMLEVSMFSISKSFSFCYGHRLLGDKGKCRHFHGHTARIVILLAAEILDDHGMVYHFDRLKETIGTWIDEKLDHAMLLSKKDPAVAAIKVMSAQNPSGPPLVMSVRRPSSMAR